MNPGKIASKAERIALKSRFARINWNAHLVPLVQEAIHEFGKKSKAGSYRRPLHSALLSEAISRGEVAADAADSHGDAVTIQFGASAVSTTSVGAPGFSRPLLTEGMAALVFSQDMASGAVAVFIYPTGSAAAKPAQPYYLIDSYRNPAELTRSRMQQLLHGLFEIDLCRSAHAASSFACGKRLVQLEARAAALRAGGVGVLGYLKYLTHLVRGRTSLYRTPRALLRDLTQPQQLRRPPGHAYRFARPPRFGRGFELARAT